MIKKIKINIIVPTYIYSQSKLLSSKSSIKKITFNGKCGKFNQFNNISFTIEFKLNNTESSPSDETEIYNIINSISADESKKYNIRVTTTPPLSPLGKQTFNPKHILKACLNCKTHGESNKTSALEAGLSKLFLDSITNN